MGNKVFNLAVFWPRQTLLPDAAPGPAHCVTTGFPITALAVVKGFDQHAYSSFASGVSTNVDRAELEAVALSIDEFGADILSSDAQFVVQGIDRLKKAMVVREAMATPSNGFLRHSDLLVSRVSSTAAHHDLWRHIESLLKLKSPQVNKVRGTHSIDEVVADTIEATHAQLGNLWADHLANAVILSDDQAKHFMELIAIHRRDCRRWRCVIAMMIDISKEVIKAIADKANPQMASLLHLSF